MSPREPGRQICESENSVCFHGFVGFPSGFEDNAECLLVSAQMIERTFDGDHKTPEHHLLLSLTKPRTSDDLSMIVIEGLKVVAIGISGEARSHQEKKEQIATDVRICLRHHAWLEAKS